MLLLNGCAPHFIKPATQSVAPAIDGGVFVSFDGTRLPLRCWLPEDNIEAVIIALHGFNDYSNFISAAAASFSGHNIAVYAYDQRGFGAAPNQGRWPGSDAFAEDLQAFIHVIQTRHPQMPLYLLGESMGAAVVLHTLAKERIDVNGVILSAPAVWGWDSMPWWQSWVLRFAAFTMPWNSFTGESLAIVASDNRDMLIALGRDPLVIKQTRVDTMYGLVNLMQVGYDGVASLQQPALILYGKLDQVIPKAPVLTTFGPLVEQNKNQRLQLYKNGYHMLLRDLQANVVWSDIISWIGHRETSLPSEAQGLSMMHKQTRP